MLILSLILAVCGYVTPENRGVTFNLFLVLYVVLSYFNGYYSLWFYVSWGGKNLKRTILLAATFVPGSSVGASSCRPPLHHLQHTESAGCFLPLYHCSSSPLHSQAGRDLARPLVPASPHWCLEGAA